MFSGQPFKCGEESGSRQNIWNRSFAKWMKVTFDSAVRGYHVYQDVWKPAAGENLNAEQDINNLMDKFAVKVMKNNKMVGHLPHEYSGISWYFLAHGGKIGVEVSHRRRHCKQLCGEMEIPCRLVFSLSGTVKLNCLKELIYAGERLKTQYKWLL